MPVNGHGIGLGQDVPVGLGAECLLLTGGDSALGEEVAGVVAAAVGDVVGDDHAQAHVGRD